MIINRAICLHVWVLNTYIVKYVCSVMLEINVQVLIINAILIYVLFCIFKKKVAIRTRAHLAFAFALALIFIYVCRYLPNAWQTQKQTQTLGVHGPLFVFKFSTFPLYYRQLGLHFCEIMVNCCMRIVPEVLLWKLSAQSYY